MATALYSAWLEYDDPDYAPKAFLTAAWLEYDDPLTADDISPARPAFSTIEATQLTTDPDGVTKITLEWSLPAVNTRIGGEFLGVATGGADVFEAAYFPVADTPDEVVYEVTGYTSGGASTTVSTVIAVQDRQVYPASMTGIAADDWLEFEEGAVHEYAQVESIESTYFLLKTRLRNAYTTSATIKEVDVTAKTVTTDYTINLSTGDVTLVAGQFTASNDVMMAYSATIDDLDGFELYRIPGEFPIIERATYAEVTGHASVVTVDDAIASSATSYEDTLTDAENGEDWTYYLFARDEIPNYSLSNGVFVETIPSIVQDVLATANKPAQSIDITWTNPADPNFNGVHVYRCPGDAFIPANAYRVSSSVVTGEFFEDGPGNTTNRRPSGEVPYPVVATDYTYKVVGVDEVTDWDTGTEVQSAETSENTVAEKTDD